MNNSIKYLRRKKKLTQFKLAKLLCISRVGLQNIENGKSIPHLDVAARIAKFFGKSVDEVFEL